MRSTLDTLRVSRQMRDLFKMVNGRVGTTEEVRKWHAEVSRKYREAQGRLMEETGDCPPKEPGRD